MDSTIEKAINQQIHQELTASHGYLAMCAYFESVNLKGMARWMRKQAGEERNHAMRLFNYLLDRGCRVRFEGIDVPPFDFASPLEAFEAAYESEKKNTRSIHELFALARKVDDYATMVHLQWFITEQVEEEKWCQEYVGLLKMAGSEPSAVLFVDRQIGEAAAVEEAREAELAT